MRERIKVGKWLPSAAEGRSRLKSTMIITGYERRRKEEEKERKKAVTKMDEGLSFLPVAEKEKKKKKLEEGGRCRNKK